MFGRETSFNAAVATIRIGCERLARARPCPTSYPWKQVRLDPGERHAPGRRGLAASEPHINRFRSPSQRARSLQSGCVRPYVAAI